MAKTLTKSQIAATLAEQHGLTKKQATEVLVSIADLAYKQAKNSFTLPGLGKLIVNGASNRDYTLVLGLVVLVTFVAVLLNLLVDLAYALLDPKIRY